MVIQTLSLIKPIVQVTILLLHITTLLLPSLCKEVCRLPIEPVEYLFGGESLIYGDHCKTVPHAGHLNICCNF
ncbi:protein of unknown function [Serratia sp. Tan611]|nr:protein of unknown function [Serratia sp. Tan611]